MPGCCQPVLGVRGGYEMKIEVKMSDGRVGNEGGEVRYSSLLDGGPCIGVFGVVYR